MKSHYCSTVQWQCLIFVSMTFLKLPIQYRERYPVLIDSNTDSIVGVYVLPRSNWLRKVYSA